MFADDTKLICTIQSVADHNQLQTDLDCLQICEMGIKFQHPQNVN